MSYKILQALTALYVKLGGTAADVANITTIPAMIKAIAGLDIGGGGGSSLPTVTADDNGKVLAVVEGAWDKANAISDNDFIVTYTDSGNDTYTSDKTFADIYSAYQAGQNVTAKMEIAGSTFDIFTLTSISNNGCVFSSVSIQSTKISVYQFIHDSNGTITFEAAEA